MTLRHSLKPRVLAQPPMGTWWFRLCGRQADLEALAANEFADAGDVPGGHRHRGCSARIGRHRRAASRRRRAAPCSGRRSRRRVPVLRVLGGTGPARCGEQRAAGARGHPTASLARRRRSHRSASPRPPRCARSRRRASASRRSARRTFPTPTTCTCCAMPPQPTSTCGSSPRMAHRCCCRPAKAYSWRSRPTRRSRSSTSRSPGTATT